MGDNRHKPGRLLLGVITSALCAILLCAACSTEIDREFGPSALQGSGELPGRVITLSPPTGV